MAVFSELYLGPNHELFNAFPTTSFEEGIVTVDRGGGVFTFGPDSNWENASSNAHIDGKIRKLNPIDFTFPSGHGGFYQPIHITNAREDDFIEITYFATPDPETDRSPELSQVYVSRYWKIENTTNSARITLSWNVNNELDRFLNGQQLNTLVIAGVIGNRWVEIPSLVDANSLIDFSPSNSLSGSITSLGEENLNNYSSITLALKGEGAVGAGEIEVMEGFTPNNDGRNDLWIVSNIESFPNAQIRIYNRLGNLVFCALEGYDNSWKGNFNANSESLPTGSYFYTIDLDADGNIDRQGWFYINY